MSLWITALWITVSIVVLTLIALLSLKIRIRILIIDLNIIITVSLGVLYFVNINNFLVYNKIYGSKAKTYFLGFALNKSKNKKRKKGDMGKLFKKIYRIKMLNILLNVGTDDAAITALICGAAESVISAISKMASERSKTECTPQYNEKIFKMRLDCIIGI